MKAKIRWFSQKVALGERVFLFCFGKKCMSGKVYEISKSKVNGEFLISVEFIEPEYFKDEIIEGNIFTINESLSILAEGEVR